jgi:REP element-mobilizing transposase RayT
MPRGARLDAPGTLHHVIVRGLDRQVIFRDDRDREDLLARLSTLIRAGALRVYAWALLPNHAHFLLRTDGRPLARSMRSLLTGYAGTFNRRHRRTGHLFQNRYKSIVVEEEPYFLEVIRYIHLNPLRAAVVSDLKGLDQYPWSGHAALIGTLDYLWQDTQEVLRQFAPTVRRARAAYREFVADGQSQGHRPDLQGGGLVRSLGGWAAVKELRRGQEAYTGDPRILGTSMFVERFRSELEAQERRAPHGLPLTAIVHRVCQHVGVTEEQCAGGGKQYPVVRAREGIAYIWCGLWSRSGRALTSALGVKPQSVYRAALRGRADRAEWERMVVRGK